MSPWMLRVAPFATATDPAPAYLMTPTNVVVPPLRLSCDPAPRTFVPSPLISAPPLFRLTAVSRVPLSQVTPPLLPARAAPPSVPLENANVPDPPTVPAPAP